MEKIQCAIRECQLQKVDRSEYGKVAAVRTAIDASLMQAGIFGWNAHHLSSHCSSRQSRLLGPPLCVLEVGFGKLLFRGIGHSARCLIRRCSSTKQIVNMVTLL